MGISLQEEKRRQTIAEIYRSELASIVDFPQVPKDSLPSYNWVMKLANQRQKLINHLDDCGIEARIHYPKLIPNLRAASECCRRNGAL